MGNLLEIQPRRFSLIQPIYVSQIVYTYISYSKKFVVYDVYSPFTYGSMANRLVNMMRTSEFDETG